MKRILYMFLFILSTQANAQQMLFGNTVAVDALPKANVLNAHLSQFYESSRYVKQTDFFRSEDFLIMISPELVVKSRFREMKKYPMGSASYVGEISGPLKGEITFSKYRDRISGMIILQDNRKYMIDQTGSNIFAISRILEGAFSNLEKGPDYLIPETKGTEGGGEPQSAVGICDSANTCGGPSVIDIMVVLTPRAITAWNGFNNSVSNITQAITNMNTSMTTTGVNNVSFRLVFIDSINYIDSGDMSRDLSRLAGTTDGYMDSVHILRNRYGADLVSLITGPGGNYCGIAYLNTSATSYSSGSPAFSVTAYNCAVGNLTFSHELGHNMGLRHDWYVDGATTPCSHHHGYVNQNAINLGAASTSSQRWRTIMAYNDHCSATGFSCTRLNRWSNPNQTYNGDPVGQPIGSAKPADEAFAFYRMACQVANFRAVPTSCNAPASLSSGSITGSSANVSWGAVSNASDYRVEYRMASDSTWTVAASATTATSLSLTNLQSLTLYYWRVQANCSIGPSSFSQSQFTTLSPCPTAPGSLSTTGITATSANLSWGAVSEAVSYSVEYKISTDIDWIILSSSHTTTSYSLTGLTLGTAYNWRVRANCSIGSSSYSQAQFTTSNPCASLIGSLSTTNITSSAATLNWGAITGVSGYDVDYKKSAETIWTNAASGITVRTLNLTGLTASTAYNWRVRPVCGAVSGNYSQANFTTAGLVLCTDSYESNNTASTAKSVSLNKTLRAAISNATDTDWFTFTSPNNSSTNIRVTISALPADYDLYLYNSSQQLIASSLLTGTASDVVVFNSTARRAKYFFRVIGKNGVFDAYNCYQFRAENSSVQYSVPDQPQVSMEMPQIPENELFVYPVPARDVLNLNYSSSEKASGEIVIMDVAGRNMQSLQVDVQPGINNYRLNLRTYVPGVYLVKFSTRGSVIVKKVIIKN